MEFKAKAVDLTLVLESQSGEKKVFYPKERACVKFVNKVQKEITMYIENQKKLPKSEQDLENTGRLKMLSWIYKDLDTSWILENFTVEELKDIQTTVMMVLNGTKKGGES